MDKRFGVVSVQMQMLSQIVVVKKELKCKQKVSIHCSVYILTLTYGYSLKGLSIPPGLGAPQDPGGGGGKCC